MAVRRLPYGEPRLCVQYVSELVLQPAALRVFATEILVASVIGRGGNISGKALDRSGILCATERLQAAKQLENNFSANIVAVLRFN
jgi:hypothetical protein